MASSSCSSAKRKETETIEQLELKRPKYPSHLRPVSLNPADSDLAFNIEADGLTGHALHEHGFAYYWSGARGTVGINVGKYYFGCRVVSNQPVDMEDTPLDQQNVCRIGISRGDEPVGNLGETEHSYGFGGTGKFSNAGRFVDYGERFEVGDTIICLVNLESEPLGSIEFCKNGKRLGIAKKFDASAKGLGDSAFFPHVLLKNTVIEMQFSLEDGLIPIEGYKPWASAIEDEKAIFGPSLAEPKDCEVIMMVGLPASGKSTWAEKWVKEHPEKRYVLLGTNLALDQMKVPGILRKNNYGERFEKLMDRATGVFNTLLSRASKVPRNYILDQTNVYKSARKRKLKPFAFYHKIAVVVLPRAEELNVRAEKRFKEMGKDVPVEAVNEMLVNFVLPMSKDMRGTDEYFDKVMYTELNRSEAQQHLDEMKRALALSSHENSVNFGSGPGQAQSRYPVPSSGVGGVAADCSRAGYREPAVPSSTAYVDPAIARYMRPGPAPPARQHQTNVNARYESSASQYHQASVNPVLANPTSREDLTRYGGYIPDPHDTLPYGSLSTLPDGTRSANQSSRGPYGYQNPTSQGQYGASPCGQPNPTSQAQYGASPYGQPDPSYQEQYGASPYGQPDPSSQAQYGASPYGHPDPSSQGQYAASSYGQPTPRPYESYPAQYAQPNPRPHESYPAQHPDPRGTAYNPPQYGGYPATAASVQHPAPGAVAYAPPPFGSYPASVQYPGTGHIANDPPRYY